jgi:hypothetical protein
MEAFSNAFVHLGFYRARAQHRGARARNRIETTRTEYLFDHDRHDVYRLSIEHVANAFNSAGSFEGLHRHRVSERLSDYSHEVDYEHEHRDAEHEDEEEPEQSDADEVPDGPFRLFETLLAGTR